MRKTLAIVLVLVMLCGMVPLTAFPVLAEEHTHTYENGVCTGCGEKLSFEGKTISILGDSISTFAGFSDDSTVNATLSGSTIYYGQGALGGYRHTWWQQIIDTLGMELLVNNSWSGTCVLKTRGTVGAYIDRCVQLHNDRTGEQPDVIAVFLGTNDYSYYQSTLGTAEIDYAAMITDRGDGTFDYAKPTTTCEAYAIMLHKMTQRYPDAEIYCLGMLSRRDPDHDGREVVPPPTSFNAELKAIVERFGGTYVDVESVIPATASEFDRYMSDRRVHPNAAGMDKITEAVVGTMLQRQVTLRNVSYDLHNVSCSKEPAAVIENERLELTLAATDKNLDLAVRVTMGGEDITSQCYANGKVSIAKITGDIVITAMVLHGPSDYLWQFDNGELISAGKNANQLTKLAGSTQDNVFRETRYQLAVTAELIHTRPWVVEWAGEGKGGFMLSQTSNSTGAPFFFRRSGNYLTAFGHYNNNRYDNYGLTLDAANINGAAKHVYRLENRIAQNGSNMVWLLVDGIEIGALNNYYIAGASQGSTADWISGKDFHINYIGSSSHPLSGYALEYLSITECAHTYENGVCTGCGAKIPNSISLRYDDHYDVTGKAVEIVDAGKPTSYQVGYGVAENTVRDTAVVTLKDDTLIATGIGSATVKIDGVLHEVTVEAAPISLLLLIGQSNMRGSEGNANQSIVCPDGMVYSTYGDDRGESNTAMTVSNANHFAPSALTGTYSSINAAGTTDCLNGYPVNSLTEAGAGKIGPDSGFAYEWVKQTGEKVWVVNAAHGGTSINVWQPGTTEYEQCQALFTACQETLRKEIAAGHFTLSHMAYFWCQGCSDRTQSAQWYVNKYLAMHNGLKTEMSFDHDSNAATADKTFEFGGIIPVRVGSTAACYRDGVYETTNPYSYHESYEDLRFSGPRVAQYWMCNNPELSDIWLVCNIGEDWVWMPDGTNGVTEYFQAHYPNGMVDYTTQVPQKASWYTPTTPKAVHDSIHYNQIGYNEVGRESVRNALIMLGEIEAPNVETTVELLSWDGYTPVDQVSAAKTGSSATLVVPKVYPVWKSKDVTYQLSDGLTWNYYDLLAKSDETEGTLTAIGTVGSVTVVKAVPGNHFASHLSSLPKNVCSGLNLWNVLEHDKYYFANGTNWSIYSGGSVYSVTIPVEAGEKIFATAWGKAGENGHATTNGIRTTFFSAYGVAKTMTPAECYAEFSANGGYLVAPEGAVTINIAMWGNSDDHEIYILNLPHDESSDICSICGKDSHVHIWSEWKTVTAPSIAGPGEDQRICSVCGEIETRTVNGIWQTTSIADHWNELPEHVCGNLNLWSVLEHDPKYYVVSSGDWGYHSSRNVPSVTFAVNPGDKIFATSFGAANVNGHGSANGIRVTWFDINGVVKTTDPAGTYTEFTKNGGYLIAPQGAVAINIPMWGDSENYEIYILNREHSYTATVTAPTCTEQGYTTHTCHCGDSYVDTYVPATGHKFGDWVVTTQPTCTTTGVQRRDCVNCDHYETATVAKLGHNLTQHAAKEPTCTAIGWNAYETCSRCDYTTYVELPAKGHSHTSVVTAPTCTEQGYTTHTCHCGDSYVDSYVPATGHTVVVDPEILPTFDKPGLTEGKHCSVCGDILVAQQPIAAKGYDEMLEDNTFKILLIGNSYSQDASNCGQGMITSQMFDIFQAMLGEDVNVVLGLASSGGKGMHWHATQADRGTRAYGFSVISTENPKWKSVGTSTSEQVLTWTDWDVVSLQPYNVNTSTGKESVPYPDSTDEKFYRLEDASVFMLDFVNQHAPQADVYCYMHWAQTKSIQFNAALSSYNKMAAFYPQVLKYVGTTSGKTFANIIPVGLSVQNARTTYLALLRYNTSAYDDGNLNLTTDAQIGLQRDGGHLSFNIGRYIAALTFAEMIIPENMRADGYVLPDIRITESVGKLPKEYTAIAQKAVLAAVGSWKHGSLAVTEIGGYTEDPTVDAGKTLEGISFALDCDTAEGLVAQLSAAVLAELPADFAVDAVAFDEVRQTATVTIRFGYTSLVVNVSCSVADHAYTATVTAPTCTEQGYTTHTCHCGDSYVDSYVPATGHKYSAWVVTTQPTCTTDGVQRRDCVNCDHYETATVAKLGHNLTQHAAKEPTCTDIGWNAYATCSRCDYTTYVELPAKGHTYTSTVTAPTCTEQGYTTHTCACGDSYVDTYVPATGHKFGDWVVTTQPTCTTDGVQRRDCVNCDHYETATVAKLGHNLTQHAAKEPTCTAIGWVAYETCSRCDYTTYVELPAKGHSHTSVVTAPTCTEQGYTTYTCACGDKYVDSYVPAVGHKFGDWVVTTQPTCTTDGVQRRDCDNCDHYETETVATLGHSLIQHAAKEPTCTAIGWGAYETCSRCDYTTYVELPAKGHSHTSVVTAPTCTEQGYTTHTCHCGDSYVDSYVPATGHKYGDWVVTTQPTCTTDGVQRRDCDNCAHYETETLAALGHNLTQHAAKEPTCTAIGWVAYETCSRCDYTTYVELSAKGHSHTSVVTAPTCTEQGYTTHTCHCGDSYVDTYVPATGHKYGDWVVTTQPTCTTDGVQRRDCVNCDHYETETVAALGHNLTQHAAKEPTCTDIGWVAYETCSRCDYITYVELPAKGHSYASVVTAPTCTEQGYTTHTCACGDSYVDTYVPATGHKYGAWVVTTQPTCTTDGVQRRDCVNCDHYETETVAALGHNLTQHAAKEPTCTAIGWVAYETCSRCDYTTYVELPAKGHNYTSVVTAPTCTEQGHTTHTCACGDSYVDSYVPATGHTYTTVVTTPTCSEPGHITYVCACGDRFANVFGEPTGEHVYDDDHDSDCNTCGAIREIIVVLIGDANGDGKVNNRDLGLLQRLLNSWESIEVDLVACDVNGDGKVNNRDLGLLQRLVNE